MCHGVGEHDRSRVRDKLTGQLRNTDELRRAHRVAETCADVPRDSLVARDVVADIIADTCEGTTCWNLDVARMTHLIDQVHRPTGRSTRRGRRNAAPTAVALPLD